VSVQVYTPGQAPAAGASLGGAVPVSVTVPVPVSTTELLPVSIVEPVPVSVVPVPESPSLTVPESSPPPLLGELELHASGMTAGTTNAIAMAHLTRIDWVFMVVLWSNSHALS